MKEAWVSFVVKNAYYLAWGVVVGLLFLSLAKDWVLEKVRGRQTAKERRSAEEELASIPRDADLQGYFRVQERLAALKVETGADIGVAELREISARERISKETVAILVRQLNRLEPASDMFQDILRLLCENR